MKPMSIVLPLLLLLVQLYRTESVDHARRLRDVSYAFGVDLNRAEQSKVYEHFYQYSKMCRYHTQCTTTTMTLQKNVPICIAMGDATVNKNGNVFNSILCPPRNYDLTYVKGNTSSSFFRLAPHSGANAFTSTMTTTATTTTTSGGAATSTTSSTSSLAATTTSSTNNSLAPTSFLPQPIVIHSKEFEKEVIGLFDAITPKQAYLIRYDSDIHRACSFHPSSKGNVSSLSNNSDVCYDAEKKGLMLVSEVQHANSHKKCIAFYTVLDSSMTAYEIVQNQTLVDEDAKRTDGKSSYTWSFTSPQMCYFPASSSAAAPTIASERVLLTVVALISSMATMFLVVKLKI